MKKIKRIFAYILIMSMVLGLNSPIGSVFAQTPVESGAITLHGNSSAGEGAGNTRIWFKTEATQKPVNFGGLTVVAGEGSVTLNGNAFDMTLLGGGSEPYLMQFAAGSVNVGDVIRIQGKFQTSDGSFVINFAETNFQFKGEKSSGIYYWEIVPSVTSVESGAISLHGNSSDGEGSGNARIWFLTEATQKPVNFVGLTAVAGEGSVTLNGNAFDMTLYGGGAEPYLMQFAAGSVDVGDIIRLQGKFQTSDGSFIINFEETNFKYKGEISTGKYYWGIATPEDLANYTEVSVTEAISPSGYSASNARYEFYFKLDKSSGIDYDKQIVGLQYRVNDGAEQPLTAFIASHGQGTLFVVLWMNEATSDTKITISGKALSSVDNSAGISLKENIDIYVNQYGWSLEDYNRPTQYADMSVNEFYANASMYANEEQGWHFYLGLDGTNPNIAFESALSGLKYSINGGTEKDLTAWYSSYQSGSYSLLCLI